VDIFGVGALGLVAIEWLGLGWLSGVDWPAEQHAFWAPRWALRLLVGGFLIALAQLVLASMGLGINIIPLVLAVAAIMALGLRVFLSQGALQTTGVPIAMKTRERLGWLLLGGVLLAASARSFLVPEAGWDAFSHWGLRAQAYALAGTIINAHSEHEY